MEKPKEPTPAEMLQEQVEILHAMRELVKLPDDDGDFYTHKDIESQIFVVAGIAAQQAEYGRLRDLHHLAGAIAVTTWKFTDPNLPPAEVE